LGDTAMIKRLRLAWIGFACIVIAASTAGAKEIYVNNQTGSDQATGTADAPLRSARRAVAMADAGDVIHLLPEGAIYREMITLADKREITIEGHNCVVSGADPLPADPAAWEKAGEGLHRIRLKRTTQDRHILVVDGKGVTMGRTKYQINPLANIQRRDGFEAFQKALRAQYPKLEELKDGEFAWEPIEAAAGWLYVKGPLMKLEWAVRPQGIYTEKEVHNITIRNLHARHALNDGYNIHGNAQGIRLFNVTAHECFDNGISPHGACSFTVQDSQFLRNEMAVGNDFLTETHFLRCTLGDSVQEELMIIGGRHLFEDCTIRSAGPVAIRLVLSRPGGNRPLALQEIQKSGKDPNMKPQYTFRGCTLESVDATPRGFVAGPNVNVSIEKCTFKGIRFQVDPAANIEVTDSTLDGKPLTAETLKHTK
jgi:hypothetical protein